LFGLVSNLDLSSSWSQPPKLLGLQAMSYRCLANVYSLSNTGTFCLLFDNFANETWFFFFPQNEKKNHTGIEHIFHFPIGN
jgi:hypothetical protein